MAANGGETNTVAEVLAGNEKDEHGLFLFLFSIFFFPFETTIIISLKFQNYTEQVLELVSFNVFVPVKKHGFVIIISIFDQGLSLLIRKNHKMLEICQKWHFKT